jgi:hypothetical protein
MSVNPGHLILRKDNRFRVFGNRAQMIAFKPKRKEVRRENYFTPLKFIPSYQPLRL